MSRKKIKIDCIADLHGHYPKLEGGDLLIISGDLTARDSKEEMMEFFSWMQDQKYRKIVFISGNHDKWMQKNHKEWSMTTHDKEIIYLCDSGTEFEGLEIWGSPWSPLFKGVNPHCTSFMLPDEALHNKWQMIPNDIDILITHCPAYGTLDYRELSDGTRYHMGSKTLEEWLNRNRPPLIHCFGHIHEAYGIAEEYLIYNYKMMKSINCSHVNDNYKPVNKPIRIEI